MFNRSFGKNLTVVLQTLGPTLTKQLIRLKFKRSLPLILKSQLHQYQSCRAIMRDDATRMGSGITNPKQLNFVQRINKHGIPEWTVQPEDYDYNQEIARAAYADMLHDHDRNVKYYEGIKIAIKMRHAAGHKAIVLDIGTGTSLLSMMALSAGADIVYACEAFQPMATCADKVLIRNKYRDRVKLIPKRSTELQVGEDMEHRANILVAEVFDTELIGEGAIEVFNHAKRELVTDDCIVVPSSAKLYAQVVDCPLIPNWNKINDMDVSNRAKISFPSEIAECYGIPCVHDLQLSEIKPGEFTKISDVQTIFEFNWNQLNPVSGKNENVFRALTEGKTTAVFFWWDLVMDPLGENIISCQPSWMCMGTFDWRDHWMQAVYYIPKSLEVRQGQEYKLISVHDEYSFWFSIAEACSTAQIKLDAPNCTCGVHIPLSRSRIGCLNDRRRRKAYVQLLERAVVPGESIVLVISDNSLLGIIAASLGAKKVFILERDPGSARVTRRLLQHNNSQGKVLGKLPNELTSQDFEGTKINLVVGDPYFQTPVQPWNHLASWAEAIRTLSWSFDDKVAIYPSHAEVKCVAVNFEHLWKIRAPVGTVCGFDLQDFDNLIQVRIALLKRRQRAYSDFGEQKSSHFVDSIIDSQPLWEYPGKACSQEIVLEAFHFQPEGVSNYLMDSQLGPMSQANGLALWIEWTFGLETLSTGITEKVVIGENIKWDRNWKQGVYFFKDHKYIDLKDWWKKATLL